MNAFELAVRAVCADRHLGVDAVWRQGGSGPGVAVRLVRRRPDATTAFGEGRFVSGTDEVLVPLANVPDLAVGDTFEVGAELLEVAGDPVRDPRHLAWSAAVRVL
ncbi:MAG: hypothetical protein ACK4GM_02310 [Tabrizicola sp.]